MGEPQLMAGEPSACGAASSHGTENKGTSSLNPFSKPFVDWNVLADEQYRKGKLKPGMAAFVSPSLLQCRCIPLQEGEWLRVAADGTFHFKMTPRHGGPLPSWSTAEEVSGRPSRTGHPHSRRREEG